MSITIEEYQQLLTTRLTAERFVELPEAASNAGAITAFRRRRLQLSRFGYAETFVFLFGQGAGPDRSAASVSASLGHKVALPRGLGSSLVIYPVFAVGTADTALTELAEGQAPKHWSALEFPVVAELGSGRLLRSDKTPIWGSAYFKTLRREADELLAPR